MIAALALLATAPAEAAPVRWSAPPVSSDQFESHPAFDPWTGDLWFVRSKPDFSGWRLKVSRCTKAGWGDPVDAPIAGAGVEADPWFSRDGKTLWFISTRSTGGQTGKDLDIWRATRTRAHGWSTPEKLPAPINSPDAEWFPRVSSDGWLYFGSKREGGLGGNDIWRARQDRDGKWRVENAGPGVNSAGEEYEALPSPDGRQLLINASDGYYASTRGRNGSWGVRIRLGSDINANGSETGALDSPSGRSWLFARDLKGGLSGELMRAGAKEAWPPACPRR